MIVSAVSGLLPLMLATKGGMHAQSDKRQRKRMLQILFYVSVFGLLFLLTGYFSPVEILVAFALSLAVMFPLIILKGRVG